MTVEEKWEQYNDEYLKFERVEKKRSNRPDLHAFMLLDELFPGDQDIVATAEHDEIWLNISEENMESLSDERILELTRCGVRLYDEFAGLCMFV